MPEPTLHYGDTFTLKCRAVNVNQHPGFNDVHNVRFEVLDADGNPTTEFSCKTHEIAPVGVTPMSADEIAALDAADAKAQADEMAKAKAAGRHAEILATWKERVNSL